ncbi:arylamine N-acetyltransferase [Paenibacillus sp. BSR1-1]|uniref:arylamine N-acetyltransferase family protein n=1 Tax=Paenibacillus sp. BSR1-1 TaxID=3020845 RepID=UPI0025B0E74A|nr:arylamine N-acetyltransferase [Paenibacillus sp. BSR1-1]MDN3016409.1 arylamine N-acetyltransferase [Paenibacillus sp. BSR1-1]
MSDFNLQFRNRIGLPEKEVITFEKLDLVLEKTAKSIPFENLCVIGKKTTEITKENLISKIIDKNEGGLCYDLNSILYLFLVENGFKANIVRGVVYDQIGQRWNTFGRTHVAIVITCNGEQFLIDTGFGGNLPLKPVPLTGEVVTSGNGEFRIEKFNNDHGDYVLFMKLKHKDKDWNLGYTFDSTDVIKDVSNLNEVQKIIIEHPESPFNKKPLITRITDRGNMILTDTSFTEWDNGKVTKQEIDKNRFKELVKDHFGIES